MFCHITHNHKWNNFLDEFSLLIDVLRSDHKQSWERKDTVIEQAAIQCENGDKQVPYP